jgi:hypothetical protein
MNCQSCNRPAKRNESVLRGNGHTVRRWHRECWAYKALVGAR